MPRAIRPGGGRHHGERERDLHIVMIDTARLEMLEGGKRAGADHEGGERGVAAGDAPGERRDGRHGGEQPEERPGGAHEHLGELRRREGAEGEKESGEPGADQARPTAVVAGRRVEADLVI